MQIGEVVNAETFDGRIIKCRLVEVRGETAIVCSEQEWAKAQQAKRDPLCLGWPLSHVRDSKTKRPDSS